MQKSSNKRYNADAIDNIGMDFISIECLEKLGLDQNPFIDHARDPFLFMDKQLEMSMNVLMDYLLNQNSTVILLGEIGIGKTTQLRMLLRKGYQQFNFCTLRAKPKITFAEIEQKIKERWRLTEYNHNDDESNLDEYQEEKYDLVDENLTTSEHIKKYIEEDKYPVLIIDDAHRLQNNVLDELLKLKHHVGLQSSHTMGLVLASEPAIQSKLAELEQTNPAATQIYQINVRPLDADQCKEYIQFRMDKAGSSNELLLRSETISDIFSRSKGLPKHINKLAREGITKLCDENISHTATTNRLQSNPSMRLGLILAGFVGLTTLFFLFTNKSDESNETVPLEINKPKHEQNITEQEESDPVEKTAEKPSDKKTVVEKEPIAKPYVAPLVLGPILDKKPEKTEQKSEVKSAAKTKADTPIQEKKVTDKPKADINKSKDQPANNNVPHPSDWILKQDANAYTIQIVASPTEKGIKDFAKQNSLTTDTAYYKKTSADKAWYVLIHGSYKSRDDALKDIGNLDDKLKKNAPYPVQFKHLQELIRQQ